jgi:hypothetical protein
MQTIQSTILKKYRKTDERVAKKLEKEGHLTLMGLEQCLQPEFHKLIGTYYQKPKVEISTKSFLNLSSINMKNMPYPSLA